MFYENKGFWTGSWSTSEGFFFCIIGRNKVMQSRWKIKEKIVRNAYVHFPALLMFSDLSAVLVLLRVLIAPFTLCYDWLEQQLPEITVRQSAS